MSLFDRKTPLSPLALSERVMQAVQITDEDRVKWLFDRGRLDIKAVSAEMLLDKYFVRRKLLAVRLEVSRERSYGYDIEEMRKRTEWERTVGEEIDRLLVEECAA